MSEALTRSVTRAPGGAVNVARNWPAPWRVTVAGVPVRAAVEGHRHGGPGDRGRAGQLEVPGGDVDDLRPGRRGAVQPEAVHQVLQGHHRLHRALAGDDSPSGPAMLTHTQEAGTRAAGSRWDRQVHTVRLAGDSG